MHGAINVEGDDSKPRTAHGSCNHATMKSRKPREYRLVLTQDKVAPWARCVVYLFFAINSP